MRGVRPEKQDVRERLAKLPAWRDARVLKANPDSPQLPVRRRALRDGKPVYMAVPKLVEEKPFVRLGREATIKGAMRDGTPVAIDELRPVDLGVCGTDRGLRGGPSPPLARAWADGEGRALRWLALGQTGRAEPSAGSRL